MKMRMDHPSNARVTFHKMDQSLLIEFNKEFSNVSNLRIESLRRLLNKIIDF